MKACVCCIIIVLIGFLLSCSKPVDTTHQSSSSAVARKRKPENITLTTTTNKENNKPEVTVKVYGTVFDAQGNCVSGALLSLQPLNSTLLTKDELQTVHNCDTFSGADGRYEMQMVPKYLDCLFIRFKNSEYPTIDFTNLLFNTYGTDVCVNVVLPDFLELKGRVTFDTGDPVPHAHVWLQKHTSDYADALIRYADFNPASAVKNSSTKSDSNGFFIIHVLTAEPYYAVKAMSGMHIPAMSGIFSRDNPPPDFINLTIQSEGARIAGIFCDSQGNPVTNVQARYTIENGDLSIVALNTVNLCIEPDGSYVSQLIHPNEYSIGFEAPGYKREIKNVSVRNDNISFVDVVFPCAELINGIVINALNGEPVPDVTLSNITQPQGSTARFSPTTDAHGRFWVRPSGWTKIQFSHPVLGSVKDYFDAEQENSNTVFTVLMSTGTTVNVTVDGLPPGKDGDYSVVLRCKSSEDTYISSNRHSLNKIFYAMQPVKNGTAVFTNIPVHFSPVYALLNTKNPYETLDISKTHELKPGDTTFINLAAPPMGTLVVELTHPFNRYEQSLHGYGQYGKRPSFSPDYGCDISEKELIWQAVPTNLYTVSFRYQRETVYSSMIVINEGETTKIFIDYKTNAVAEIHGTTLLADSTPVICYVKAYTSNGTEVAATPSRNGEFVIKYLDPAQTYILSAALSEFGVTNVTVNNVSPSGAPVNIIMGSAYRISGNLIDSMGTLLSAEVRQRRHFYIGPGNFRLFPVLPGTHRIQFDVEGFAPIVKVVTVGNADVDLGDIVFYDTGYAVSGTVVMPDGSPAINTTVILTCAEARRGGKTAKTNSDGIFTVKNMADNINYTLLIKHARDVYEFPVGTITSDTDLGELKLKTKKQ